MIKNLWIPVLAAALSMSAARAADYSAVLDWSGRVTLTLSVPGVLETMQARAGQVVKKGDLLASLEPTLYKAAVAETRADLDRLGEEQADAQRDLDRVQELYARTVSSTTELDAAKLRFARAQAGLSAAQARAEKARRQLAESELRAPFDALILARHGEPGLVVTIPCQPPAVYSIARADELVARAQLDAGQAAGLALGGDADVQVNGKSYRGKVSALTAMNDGRYGVEVALPRKAGLLAGLKATVRLP